MCHRTFSPFRDTVHQLEHLNSNTTLQKGRRGRYQTPMFLTHYVFRGLVLFLRSPGYRWIIPLVLTPIDSNLFLLLQPLQGTTGSLGLLAVDPWTCKEIRIGIELGKHAPVQSNSSLYLLPIQLYTRLGCYVKPMIRYIVFPPQTFWNQRSFPGNTHLTYKGHWNAPWHIS